MIDLSTGEIILHEEDFTLEGPIPFSITRNYFSFIDRKGLLGEKWHLNLEQHIHIDETSDYFVWQNCSGNIIEIPLIPLNDKAFVTEHQFSYEYQEKGILIHRYEKDTHYFFEEYHPKKWRLSKIYKGVFEINYQYKRDGLQIHQITDYYQRNLLFRYDKKARIESIWLDTQELAEAKRLISYRYEDGFLQGITDILEQEETCEYQDKNLQTLTRKNKSKNCWEYQEIDKKIRCVKRYELEENSPVHHNVLHYTYEGNKTSVRDFYGDTSQHFFEDGNLIKTINALGQEESWSYGLDNELIKHTDRAGNATYFGYDEYGNKTSELLPNGGKIQFAYEDNRLIMAKNALGAIWHWEYNETGLLTEQQGPKGDITRYEYEDGLLKTVIDSLGEETHIHYHPNKQIKEVRLPDGDTMQWAYNEYGQTTQEYHQDKRARYVYDALGRLTEIFSSLESPLYLKYDAMGNMVEAKNSHQQVAFTYAHNGKLLKRQQNDTEIRFRYNRNDDLSAIINEAGKEYIFKRNAIGEIVREIGFDGKQHRYFYDAGGRMSHILQPNGETKKMEYDLLGNLTKIYFDDQERASEYFRYNQAGQLIEATNEHSRVLFERDPLGNIISEQQNGVTIQHQYNRQSQRIGLESSLGLKLEIKRNNWGQIEAYQALQGDKEWQMSLKQNHLGLETERLLPGGVSLSTERDVMGKPLRQLTQKGKQTYQDRRYSWNNNNKLTGIENRTNGDWVQFSYNPFGYLAKAQYSTGESIFKMPDVLGNLFHTQDKDQLVYTDAGGLLADRKKEIAYQYDKNGNLTYKHDSKGAKYFFWDAHGRLKKASSGNRTYTHYEYDALGRRISKKVGEQAKIHYIYDGNVLLHEFNGEPSETLGFEETQNLTTWLFEEGTFVPMAKLTEGNAYSIVCDHLGTPILSFDEQGKQVWERELDIYGRVRKGDSEFIPFLYQGQYYDQETGLAYNRFRYYDASSGLYVSQDPIGLAGGMPNMYSYVEDLTVGIDPFGLEAILTIYADSPVNDPIGHAFIGLNENGKKSFIGQWPSPGFSKRNIPKILMSDMGGKLDFNDITHLDSSDLVSVSYKLDDTQAKNLKQYISEFESGNSKTKGYNLRNRQCASFAYGAAKASGVTKFKMPWYKWVTPRSLAKKIKSVQK